MLRLEIKPYTLHFKFSAKTSRGKLADRKVWFIRVSDGAENFGLGEVAPISNLSPENIEEVPELLAKLVGSVQRMSRPRSDLEVFERVDQLVPEEFPSVRSGLEVALLDLIHGGIRQLFSTEVQNLAIPINGLIWMGDRDFMEQQIREKLDDGFTCIKLKVGSLDFETELEIIKNLRRVSEDLIIRLDANGAFQTNEVLFKLKELSKFNIHSIEQPIMPRQPEAMELVCNRSEIPVALDEELIGITNSRDRVDLLQELKPHYLVLKPTLHGGFASVKDWIDLADIHGIGWWITSYLESNVGLNAIAQFAGAYPLNKEHHGLGTGGIYTNNIQIPITIEQGVFKYNLAGIWADPFTDY